MCTDVCGGRKRGSDPSELGVVGCEPQMWELGAGVWLSRSVGHALMTEHHSPPPIPHLPTPHCSFFGRTKGKVVSLTLFILFNHCPFLLPQGEDVEKVLDEWKEYKMGVPTYGAIILDETLENVSAVSKSFSTFLPG